MPGGSPYRQGAPPQITPTVHGAGQAIGHQDNRSPVRVDGVYVGGNVGGNVAKYAVRIGPVRLSVGNLAAILVAFVIFGGGSVAAVNVLADEHGSEPPAPRTGTADLRRPGAGTDREGSSRRHLLSLSPSTVRIGDSYVASVTGLAPGERVQLYWTGPTSGTIAVLAADSQGRARMFVREGAAPGKYTIKAQAESSGHTAEAPLRVISGG